MNKQLLIIILCAVPMFSLLAQSQQNISLNGDWKFQTDLYSVGEEEAFYKADYDDTNWDEMSVPGNWDLKNEYAYYVGDAWYRTDFDAEAAWKSQNVRLFFESVYNDSEVWLNGQKIGENHLGFLPFWFDINSYLNFGGKNVLVLKVNNTFKRGAIWNWGGIRRPVKLEVTNPVRLEYQHMSVLPDLSNGSATGDLEFEVYNSGTKKASLNYEVSIAKDGQPIQNLTGKLSLKSGTKKKENLTIMLPKDQVKLWLYDSPELYQVSVSIKSQGKVIHSLSDRFGIRKLEVVGEELHLNGQAIRPVGFNVVCEDRFTGNTLPLWRIKEDVDMLKELGVNMARISHLPLPKEYLDYLDEKGIMTFEEVSLWGKDAMVDPTHPTPKEWLERMVHYHYNHPSVVGWSVGNEIGYLTANPKVMEYVEGAIAHAKQLDPNRLSVYVSHSADNQKVDPIKFSDIGMMNKYGGWGSSAEKTYENHGSKPIFYSEFGHTPNHEDFNKGEIKARSIMGELRNKPYVVGVSLWTFNDYRSVWKSRPLYNTLPSENRAWGVVNTFRQKKKSYYTFRKEYAPVKGWEVSSSPEKPVAGKKVSSTVKITPRAKYDIPASTLENYSMLWQLISYEGEFIDGRFQSLKTIQPGDAPFSETFDWEAPSGDYILKVELLDPQQYSVYDTTVFFSKPETPTVTHSFTGTKSIRLEFEKDISATSYFVRYYDKDSLIETPTTINPFIDIQKLKIGKTYKYQLVALNGFGESTPTEWSELTIDESELPPIVWKAEGVEEGFYVGYSVDRTDYMFDIRYGTKPGEYMKTIGLRNVGVAHVPNLKNNTTYYFQIRRRKQWGFASEWSTEQKVVTGDSNTSIPQNLHVIRNEDKALILFDPVERSTGYTLKVSDQNGSKAIIEEEITAAASGKHLIKGLKVDSKYQFDISVINND